MIKRLFGKFYFKLEYEGGSYEVKYKCDSCKSVLEPVSKISERHSEILRDLKEFTCPECGKHSLYKDESGIVMWD